MPITLTTKRVLERKIEGATWGLLLIWLGVHIAAHLPKGIPALVAGSILLASALLQRAIGGDAGIVYWGSGLGLALWGLNDRLSASKHNFPVLATVLIVVGVFVLLRTLGASHRPHLSVVRHHRHDEGPRRPPVDL
ncbi:MAG: hypothetical protein ABR552_08865 [Actinomycetota bacterium]